MKTLTVKFNITDTNLEENKMDKDTLEKRIFEMFKFGEPRVYYGIKLEIIESKID